MVLCRSEEEGPLDGRDQTIVFQVAVLTSTFSSPSLIATGLFVKLAIYHSFCTNKLKGQNDSVDFVWPAVQWVCELNYPV